MMRFALRSFKPYAAACLRGRLGSRAALDREIEAAPRVLVSSRRRTSAFLSARGDLPLAPNIWMRDDAKRVGNGAALTAFRVAIEQLPQRAPKDAVRRFGGRDCQ